MLTATQLLLAALAASAAAQSQSQSQGQAQFGGAVSNSPPPIVAVPWSPPAPVPAASTPPMPVVVGPPQERRPAQSLISPDDYPMSALANREQGRVGFTLDVGPDGRVHGCTITRSSGSSALDAATCMLLRRRARFTPAVDSNGQPAPGRIRQEIEWRLPE